MNISWAEMPRNLEISFKCSVEATENTTTLCKLHKVYKGFRPMNLMLSLIECFHMTSWRPYWFPKPVLRELNSFLVQTLSFVPINLHICYPREWKHSISQIFSLYLVSPRSLCESKLVPVFFSILKWRMTFTRTKPIFVPRSPRCFLYSNFFAPPPPPRSERLEKANWTVAY